MAGTWISGMVGNYVSQFVQPAVKSSGDFAGNALSGLGNGINGVGQSIEGSIRRYGDGAKDYGNAVKDWTDAPGVRTGTAGNPLGLSDSRSGGKNNLTRPRLQAPAPKKKEAPAPKKPEAQRALPAASAPQKKAPVANGVKKDVPAPRSAPSTTTGSKSSAPSQARSEAGKKQNTARKDRRLNQDKEGRDKKADAALKRLAMANAKPK